MFDPAPAPTRAPYSRQRRIEASNPRDAVLHIFWAAGLEGHALGAIARRSVNPDERKALRELQTLEYRVKDAAARVLHDVWQLSLPGTAYDEDSPDDLAA